MNHSQQLLDRLVQSSLYREYERAFAFATGLPLALVPLDEWNHSLRGKLNENPFCALMAQRSATCASCLRVQERLQKDAALESKSATCDYGFREAAIPIRVGQQTIGYLRTGQARTRELTPADRKRFERQFAKLGSPAETAALRAAWFDAPIVSAKKFSSAIQLLEIFAEHLSIVCNQIAVQAENSEPLPVTRAKEYIRAHHEEAISLAEAARAACTSTYYLCKLFKKATGMNFTEYVARVRVEEAKRRLLNRNQRISEVAYAVGFQSLTHFNRVFRSVAGESPTEYRMALQKAA